MAKAKEIVGLDCGAGAGEMIRLILSTRLAEMVERRGEALEGDGVDGVHDMRVASRRLRSALRDFAPYMGKKKLDDALGEVKRVADALGRVRDHDVAIIELEKIADEAPPEVRPGVEEFARARRVEREAARAKLAPEISEERLAGLQSSFRAALEQALRAARRSGRRSKGGDAPPEASLRRVGREITLERWDELSGRCAASIYRPFKTRRLHRSRIAAKRLRYALELFAPCWGAEFREYADEISKLQKSLGDLHDCDEWIELMGERLSARGGKTSAASADGDAAARRDVASVWLLNHFVRERTKNYDDALARWHEWQREGFAARLRGALSADGGVADAAPTTPSSTDAPDNDSHAAGEPRPSNPSLS